MRIARRPVADADHDRGEGRAQGLAGSGLSGHRAPALAERPEKGEYSRQFGVHLGNIG